MRLVRALEHVELLRHGAVLVGQERKRRADPGTQSAVHVWLVDGHGGKPAVLTLDLLLHLDQPAQAHLLLRAPPASYEAEHERVLVGDLAQPELGAGVVG